MRRMQRLCADIEHRSEDDPTTLTGADEEVLTMMLSPQRARLARKACSQARLAEMQRAKESQPAAPAVRSATLEPYESVAMLQADGHRVWLSPSGDVLIWPAIHPDAAFTLESNSQDVSKVLADTDPVVH
jgi:hypothetical protein